MVWPARERLHLEGGGPPMNTSGENLRRSCWMTQRAPLAVGFLALLLVCVEVKAQPPGFGEPSTVQSTVRSFTTAPMGEVDGAVLDDGTVIHWPPHLADRFTGIVARGDRVRVAGRMEIGPAGDTHLEVQTATNLRTNASA